MNVLYLTMIVVGLTVQAVIRKEYNRRHSLGTFTFSACTIVFALLFFVFCMRGRFAIDAASAWYAVAFAIAFAVANLSSFLAVQTGPLSLTVLFTSYSLLIPTAYGLISLGEPITLFLIIGLILLVVSIFLSNFEKKGNQKQISAKWVAYIVLNFITNGGCSTIQKMQQHMAGGLYKNEFMIIALSISAVCLFAVALMRERKQILPCMKHGILFYAICGVANGVMNLLVMVLSGKMAASLMFPIISGGSIILSTALSLFVYKERLNRIQLIGVGIGVLSVICLNI